MTTLLALDTATENCSVALLYKDEITQLQELAGNTATQRILPMVDTILHQSGINLHQVDALVFGRGPASFTGVRVATGITQGLALGADLPVIPISNLTAMAEQARQTQGANLVLSAIDARMNEVYFTLLQNLSSSDTPPLRIGENFSADLTNSQWKNILPEAVGSAETVVEQLHKLNLTNITPVGTGIEAHPVLSNYFQDFLFDNEKSTNQLIRLPEARFMLSLALDKFKHHQWVSSSDLEPTYLRNNVTHKARKA